MHSEDELWKWDRQYAGPEPIPAEAPATSEFLDTSRFFPWRSVRVARPRLTFALAWSRPPGEAEAGRTLEGAVHGLCGGPAVPGQRLL